MDLTQPASQIIVIVLFLVPGFIYLWTYERLVGRLSITGTERLLRAVAMSTVVYAVSSAWLVRLVSLGVANRLSAREGVPAAMLMLLVAPFALGVVVAQVKRRGSSARSLRFLTSLHPAPTAWDFAVETMQTPLFIRVRLKSGRYVGGLFAGNSFASSYPEPISVFIEQAWWMSEDGEFIEPVVGTAGAFVAPEEVEAVEWLEIGGASWVTDNT